MGNKELETEIAILRQQAEDTYGTLLTALMSLASAVETLSAQDSNFAAEYQSRLHEKVEQVKSTGDPSVVSALLGALLKTGKLKPS